MVQRVEPEADAENQAEDPEADAENQAEDPEAVAKFEVGGFREAPEADRRSIFYTR
jgi:hypothetical protein